jgi:hypothetical protein
MKLLTDGSSKPSISYRIIKIRSRQAGSPGLYKEEVPGLKDFVPDAGDFFSNSELFPILKVFPIDFVPNAREFFLKNLSLSKG